MSVVARIKGAKRIVEVTLNQAFRVAMVPRPPSDWTKAEVGQKKILSTFFATSAGSSDMTVNGSATAQEFEVAASADHIRWIKSIRLTHAATGMNPGVAAELRNFGGAGAALSNGLTLTALQSGTATQLFTDDGIRSTAEIFAYDRLAVIHTDGYASTKDYLFATIELPVPVGLFPGTTDRLYLTVQDDLSGSDELTALAEGWEEKL